MKKNIFWTAIIVLTVACVVTLTAEDKGRYLCQGTVTDGGVPVQDAIVYCSHYHNGWCATAYDSPDTTNTDGFFLMASGAADQGDYYAVCVRNGTKWAHVLNFYSNGYQATDLGTIQLNSTTHPAHQICPD